MELIDKPIELSKIDVKPEEKSKYQFESDQIFKLISRLQEVKIDQNIEVYNFSNLPLPLREDKVTQEGIAEMVTSNAPAKEFNCFAVPKVKE